MKLFKSKKCKFILAAIIIILTGFIGIGVKHFLSLNKSNTRDIVSKPLNPINYGPPTQQEKKDSEAYKDELLVQSQSTIAYANEVQPLITTASQNNQIITVKGYVPGIVENRGTCIITLEKSSLKIVKKVEAAANASTTDCALFQINRDELNESGEWRVSIAYKSEKYSGTSQLRPLTVQ